MLESHDSFEAISKSSILVDSDGAHPIQPNKSYFTQHIQSTFLLHVAECVEGKVESVTH